MIVLGALLAVLLLSLLAARFGVDSRDGRDWQPRRAARIAGPLDRS